MTLRYLYLRIQYYHLIIQSKVIRIIIKTVEKHLWFYRLYSWYFKKFRFNEKREYGNYYAVRLVNQWTDEMIAKIFAQEIKMFIPEHLHSKIEYLRNKSNSIRCDTIGWIYRGTG